MLQCIGKRNFKKYFKYSSGTHFYLNLTYAVHNYVNALKINYRKNSKNWDT